MSFQIAIAMFQRSKFPGCLLKYPGCFLCCLLLSRMLLVVSSKDISDEQFWYRQAPKREPQITEEKHFNEPGSTRFQENVFEKESRDQTPWNEISDALNDGGAKCFERENISTERHANRVRRTPEDAVFDEDEIQNLTEIAQQNCPYSTFCHSNRNEDKKFRVGYGSCCKDCFCDDLCGEHMDCCWDYIDKKKIVETNKLSCVAPVTPSENEHQAPRL